MTIYYAGIGSRETPSDICAFFTQFAKSASAYNMVLRSGGAQGADKAFQAGAEPKLAEIYTADMATAEAMKLAAQFHPAWDKCSDIAKQLHGRNAFQIRGFNLMTPVAFVICWTPDGCEHYSTRSIKTGGTGTAISIASAIKIPVFNLKNAGRKDECIAYVKKLLKID